jgi:hypothetical protein
MILLKSRRTQQIDHNTLLTPDNVEAVTLRILEEMAPQLLAWGFDTPQKAYEFVDATSDIITGVHDYFDSMELDMDCHEELIRDHLEKCHNLPQCLALAQTYAAIS